MPLTHSLGGGAHGGGDHHRGHLVVTIGTTAYLIGTMVMNIVSERRGGVRKI
jgi:hypothetical protein